MQPRWPELVRDVHDFPEPGIVFKDITPVLADPSALREVVDELVGAVRRLGADHVVGIEARGFMFGPAVAVELGAGFVPVRKPGKLPAAIESETYALEYGTDTLEVHADALGPGDQVVVVDDVIATGGTAEATCRLVERLGAHVVGVAALIELAFLDGRARLERHHRLDTLLRVG